MGATVAKLLDVGSCGAVEAAEAEVAHVKAAYEATAPLGDADELRVAAPKRFTNARRTVALFERHTFVTVNASWRAAFHLHRCVMQIHAKQILSATVAGALKAGV